MVATHAPNNRLARLHRSGMQYLCRCDRRPRRAGDGMRGRGSGHLEGWVPRAARGCGAGGDGGGAGDGGGREAGEGGGGGGGRVGVGRG